MLQSFSALNSIRGIGVIFAFAQLLRLPVSFLAGMAGYAACYTLNSSLAPQCYFLTAGVLFGMTAASCTINDYWDISKDRINHPDRPLPSGRISPRQAWWAAVILFACALMAALALGGYPFILATASTVLLWNYSHLLQYSGILGNVIVATVIALLIMLGSLVADRPFSMVDLIGFLFFYALAREIVWDIHDAEGDRRQGVVTIANRWGIETAFRVAWILLGGLAVAIPIILVALPMAHPVWFASCVSLMLLSFGIPLAFYQQQPNEEAYQRVVFWERLGMMLGVLGLLGASPLR